MKKVHFPARVAPPVVARIQALAKALDVSYSEVISLALDALEHEQKAGGTIAERMAFLEKNVAAFFNLVMTFSDKIEERFAQASVDEKERLKSLFKLLNIKLTEHDEAEEARFDRFVVGKSEAPPYERE